MRQEEIKKKWLAFKLEWFGGDNDIEKKEKREVIFELALFLVLGILLGITIKTEAIKRITIGFNDYKITSQKNGYDVEEIKKIMEQQLQAGQQAAQQK